MPDVGRMMGLPYGVIEDLSQELVSFPSDFVTIELRLLTRAVLNLDDPYNAGNGTTTVREWRHSKKIAGTTY
jgi:hypothetical protein